MAVAEHHESKAVLDACCGSRMMWFDKENPLAEFLDIRQETITVTDRTHREDGTRTVVIDPDTVGDFRDMPFPDNSFHIVAFDPPHLERAGKKSWLAAKYGKLSNNWRDDLRQGFAECLRVLKPGGTLVFKWNESQVKVREVIELAPIAPLFGQVSGRNGMTHWLVFMKPVVATNEITNK
jgi:ubiquinone/menaquinone biosynthesis C-methylase UbiE